MTPAILIGLLVTLGVALVVIAIAHIVIIVNGIRHR